MDQQKSPNINLKNTSAIKTESGGNIFHQGIILRRVSKFVMGSQEDAIIPIPIAYDPETGKILSEMLPSELREEYADFSFKTV